MRLATFSLLIVLLSSCASPIRELFPPKPFEPVVPIYLADHGYHVGLIVPRDLIPPGTWPGIEDFTDYRYVEIGWGDQGFYTAPKITVGLVLSALFYPTSSVVHVVGFNEPVRRYFSGSDVKQINLSRAGFREMCTFIGNTYRLTDNATVERLGAGIYGYSQFYRARGRYYFPKTCNQWTAKALRKAGVPISPFFSFLAGTVMCQAGRVEEEEF